MGDDPCLTFFQSRIRRVKCDETQPFCRKCVDSGRRCEGPGAGVLKFRFIEDRQVLETSQQAPSPKASRKKLLSNHHGFQASPEFNIERLSPGSALSLTQHNDAEKRAFDFFIHRAAPCYAGAIEEALWTNVVPCLAQSDPFVWNTVVSTSYMFEHVPYDALIPSFRSKHTPQASCLPHRQALEWYNRAISNLRRRIELQELDDTFALLSCILCLCIEFQQRNVGNAMHLMQSAYKICGQLLLKKRSLPRTQGSPLDEIVLSFFTRHALLVANLVVIPPFNCIDDMGADDALTPSRLTQARGLDEIRSELYRLMYQAYEVIRIAVLMWNDAEVMDSLQPKSRVVRDELKRWRARFEEALPAVHKNDKSNKHVPWLASHMTMCWNVAYILLSTCTSTSETVFDDYAAHFAEIVVRAEMSLRLGADTAADGALLSEMNVAVVPPLHFVGVKCRDPLLRRKALWLLRQAPRTGLWADVLTPRVVEESIALEEAMPYVDVDLTDSPTLAALRTRRWPPEHRRLQHIVLVSQERSASGYATALQLGRIAVDKDGSRRTVHESLWVEDPISPAQQ